MVVKITKNLAIYLIYHPLFLVHQDFKLFFQS